MHCRQQSRCQHIDLGILYRFSFLILLFSDYNYLLLVIFERKKFQLAKTKSQRLGVTRKYSKSD